MLKGVSGIKTTAHPEKRRIDIRKILMRNGGRMSTEDIHSEMVMKWSSLVSPSTTRRDLRNLERIGFVLRHESEKLENHRSWYWSLGSESMKFAFSPEESMTITAILQHAERFGFWMGTDELVKLRDYAAGTMRRLSKGKLVAEGRISSATRFIVLKPGQHDPKHLIEIQQALYKGYSLKIRYRPRDAGEVECTYVLRPLALSYQDSNIYLSAYVSREEWHGQEPAEQVPRGKYSSNGPGTTCALMLHRMVNVTQAREDVLEPEGFDVRSLETQRDLMTVHSDKRVSLELNLSDNLFNRLSENALESDQKIERGPKGWMLTCKTLDTQGLRLFLLANANGIEVVAPAYLREHIRTELEAALTNYRR